MNLVHPEIVAAVVHEHIVFFKAAFVKQQCNSFSGGEFALGMLGIYPRLSAAEPGDFPLLDEFFNLFRLDAHVRFKFFDLECKLQLNLQS